MDIINKMTEEAEKNNFVRIFKGSILAIALTLILLLIFSILLAYTNLPENIITPMIIIISGISILVGSLISSKTIKKQGILNGMLVAVIYIAIIYAISSIIEGNFGLNIYSIIMIIASIIMGAIGGIVGVNFKK